MRGIGYSFQLAITTPRINLIGYGTATAQSYRVLETRLIIPLLGGRYSGVHVTIEKSNMLLILYELSYFGCIVLCIK